MCGGAPPAPSVPPPPPPPEPAKEPDKEMQAASQSEQQQALAAKGTQSTVLTTGLGAEGEATTQKKKLLGQ